MHFKDIYPILLLLFCFLHLLHPSVLPFQSPRTSIRNGQPFLRDSIATRIAEPVHAALRITQHL